ncbi:MAG: 4-hydroxythreonine-4-phosphate dehydrogenase PdxA [Deltaproteobacteria bacterium]|nr:4-hydroxythreonine-4-phosphate dehydrogenase PdxA [Deltaproteobacteria bacterium]
MGDGAGIGPEIIVKALMDKKIYEICQPLIIGDRGIMERAVLIEKAPVTIRGIEQVHEAHFVYGTLDILDLKNLSADLPFAKVDGRAGKAAYEYIEKAVQLALKEELSAMATAPINKEALAAGGSPFPGHTEILSSLSGTKNYAMMLISKSLKVIHVSTHVSLRQACDLVKKERIIQVIKLADEALRHFGMASPRIAVAGLNPHAGEGGLFGREEVEEIIPAVSEAQALGLRVTGPVSPDTVFYRTALKHDFDLVVVMYHDQGHIPLKLQGFEDGVNVTVGLPFIRTSVDHGTAFDLAGKGTADHRSMTEAIRTAATMARSKKNSKYLFSTRKEQER